MKLFGWHIVGTREVSTKPKSDQGCEHDAVKTLIRGTCAACGVAVEVTAYMRGGIVRKVQDKT